MGRKKDDESGQIARMTAAVEAGDDQALAAETDKLPEDSDGLYIIP